MEVNDEPQKKIQQDNFSNPGNPYHYGLRFSRARSITTT
jgi:hypothetical protein